jgi:hypothetical protein
MLVLCTMLALFWASSAYAQPTATLQGRVLDPSGAVLPHASITLRSDTTGIDRGGVVRDFHMEVGNRTEAV